MACVCLLGTAQLLKPSHQTGHCHPHFLFHIDFHMYLLFYHYFVSSYTWLYVLYASVYFCKLCIRIVMFMYSYCYVCSVLGIQFHCAVLYIECV